VAAHDSRMGRSSFEYDAAHRLVGEARPDRSHVRYVHDAAGNLLAKHGLASVAIGAGNRLVAANGETFAYNDRDHVASREGPDGVTYYEYDSCDRLVRCVTPRGDWMSAYDPLGRRVTKSWQGATTEFYWDDHRLAAERGPDGGLRVYVYLDADALVPFMFVDFDSDTAPAASGRRYFVFTNQIGAPIHIEDEQGRTVWLAVVDPYGLTHVRSGNRVDFALRFPGHYEDREIGLFYNRFRHYSPTLGRYLQSDPLGVAGGRNLYAYPANPLTVVDLFGLHPPKNEDGDDASKKGPDQELLPNQLPERLPQELADAAALGVKPLRPGDPGFEDMVNSGPVKWVVSADGELLVIPHTVDGQEIPHTVASGGQPVQAAGEANIASAGGKAVGLDIDPHSGHYLNGATPERSAAAEQRGRDAFGQHGISFPPGGDDT
jgi:RHS repeat-associated protein